MLTLAKNLSKIDQNIVPYESFKKKVRKIKRAIKSGQKRTFRPTVA